VVKNVYVPLLRLILCEKSYTNPLGLGTTKAEFLIRRMGPDKKEMDEIITKARDVYCADSMEMENVEEFRKHANKFVKIVSQLGRSIEYVDSTIEYKWIKYIIVLTTDENAIIEVNLTKINA